MSHPPARYIVMNHDGDWKINLNNRYFGPFATQDAAVAIAIETARKAEDAGHPSSVLLMEGSAFTPLWTKAQDGGGDPA